jgi:hypothetical protein
MTKIRTHRRENIDMHQPENYPLCIISGHCGISERYLRYKTDIRSTVRADCRRGDPLDADQCATMSATVTCPLRKVKFVAIAAIAALLGTPAFADSEYDVYAMLVGLTASPL